MVLAVSVGTAHAADQFTTLAGVPAQSLTAAQMEQVQGKWSLSKDSSTKLTAFKPAEDSGKHDKTGTKMTITDTKTDETAIKL